MRSQLTRHVLRRLLASDAHVPLLPLRSTFVLSRSRPTFRVYPVGSRVVRTIQKRTFVKEFFGQKSPRALKQLETEPGYATLLRFHASENIGVQDSRRPPTPDELVTAWREFFAYKTRHRRAVNSTQALSAHRVLLHLSSSSANSRSALLSKSDLRNAMECLLKPPRDYFEHHVDFSKEIYSEIKKRGAHQPKDFNMLLTALSQYGKALEARDMVLEYFQSNQDKEPLDDRLRHFIPVIQGLAEEGREPELLDLFAKAEEAGFECEETVHCVMATYFAKKNKVEETKTWFNKPIKGGNSPLPTTYYEILRFALRNGEKEWAMGIYQDLISKIESGSWKSNKACWDTAYQWAILLLGKGMDHIEHMMKVAHDFNQDDPESQPNIETVNMLVQIATDKNDPYMAERFIALSKKLGFEPNWKTYILQLEYRIRANDLDGAFTAYQALEDLDVSTKDRGIEALNSLIRAMCAVPNPVYERVLDVTSYLEQQLVTLEPETVASICMAFLKNDETYEVIDTLSLHTAYYSVVERSMVQEAFVNYCLYKKTSTARIWDAYSLLRQFFPETKPESRVRIMEALFERNRADMAAHTFGHMRAIGNPRLRPTLDTYVRFFEGIGKCPDEESMKIVHNMLKMDTTIQPNTLLYNALMIAHVACGLPYQSLDLWKDITTSPEGPSYASLEIVLRAYEITPDGDALADELWGKMQRMEIDIPRHVHFAYVVTMAAHSHLTKAKSLLEDMEKAFEQPPDSTELGHVYNALPSREMKEEFKTWAVEEYPKAWGQLKAKYKKRDQEGLAVFKVRRRPWKA
ncbi:complex I intermediate-associated protein [Annulohypoxylon maeteangense]|uniref:complex I intermediate-associated protein n=1 Tax=Annulohypoxylon maeteangense TaxID=1927788 RepID=UPI002008906D|nr:complex I intermediate-associated protein [Annulohypoxylon maeteangense]KAI0885454.1 complex I intermediate-associated protein [Annulohypoxylon maeteangense]